MADDTLFREYQSVAEDTAKLSDRRQTVGDLFLGINSLFLAAIGFVAISGHLMSWWAAIICGAITLITLLINSIWFRLIGRYRNLINLRIHYLQALERRLQELGMFTSVDMTVEGGKEPIPIARGIYLIENSFAQYKKGPKVGFYRLERQLVVIFMFAYILLTAAVAILTYLVSLRMLAPLPLTVQAALNG
ncbi:MAG TPA: hypothetical protein VH591_12820 [Ktedonobacterales bacterium]|jgi:hypothetical protein